MSYIKKIFFSRGTITQIFISLHKNTQQILNFFFFFLIFFFQQIFLPDLYRNSIFRDLVSINIYIYDMYIKCIKIKSMRISNIHIRNCYIKCWCWKFIAIVQMHIWIHSKTISQFSWETTIHC